MIVIGVCALTTQSRFFLEKLIVPMLVKSPAVYANAWFISMFTTVCNITRPSAR